MLFHKPSSYFGLKVFECLYYAYNLKSKHKKFESRTRKCFFIGYPQGKKVGSCMIFNPVNTLFLEMLNFISINFFFNKRRITHLCPFTLLLLILSLRIMIFGLIHASRTIVMWITNVIVLAIVGLAQQE